MYENSVRVFVEKIHKMGYLEGSGVPVLHIGRTVPKGSWLAQSAHVRRPIAQLLI
jgi:hypothetical protein